MPTQSKRLQSDCSPIPLTVPDVRESKAMLDLCATRRRRTSAASRLTPTSRAAISPAIKRETHGVNRQLLNRHVRQGRFERVRLRALSHLRLPDLSRPPSTTTSARGWRGPEKATVSHESALALLELSDNVPDSVHLLVPRRHRGSPSPVGRRHPHRRGRRGDCRRLAGRHAPDGAGADNSLTSPTSSNPSRQRWLPARRCALAWSRAGSSSRKPHAGVSLVSSRRCSRDEIRDRRRVPAGSQGQAQGGGRQDRTQHRAPSEVSCLRALSPPLVAVAPDAWGPLDKAFAVAAEFLDPILPSDAAHGILSTRAGPDRGCHDGRHSDGV
jgi:hypothetical protein